MGLFDKIFRPGSAKESERALQEARGFFQTLTAYRPIFTNWGGAIYESEVVRAAIDARARHISKLKVETFGAAQPSLQAKLKQGPNLCCRCPGCRILGIQSHDLIRKQYTDHDKYPRQHKGKKQIQVVTPLDLSPVFLPQILRNHNTRHCTKG